MLARVPLQIYKLNLNYSFYYVALFRTGGHSTLSEVRGPIPRDQKESSSPRPHDLIVLPTRCATQNRPVPIA